MHSFIRCSWSRHPKEMGGPEVETFVSMLVAKRNTSPPTHSLSLSALLSLCKATTKAQWSRKSVAKPLIFCRISFISESDILTNQELIDKEIIYFWIEKSVISELLHPLFTYLWTKKNPFSLLNCGAEFGANQVRRLVSFKCKSTYWGHRQADRLIPPHLGHS